MKRGKHSCLPFNGMGSLDELPRRLASQHIAARRSHQLVGRVRLAALELLDRKRACEALNIGMKPVGQRRSEEHTSELQSLMRISYAVFSLNKKNIQRL